MKNLLENLEWFYITWVWVSLELGYLDEKEEPIDWLEQAKRHWEFVDKLKERNEKRI